MIIHGKSRCLLLTGFVTTDFSIAQYCCRKYQFFVLFTFLALIEFHIISTGVIILTEKSSSQKYDLTNKRTINYTTCHQYLMGIEHLLIQVLSCDIRDKDT